MKQNSLLEQALLQVEKLEEAVKKNAKGILASTMKQELNELLKEQSEQEDDLIIPNDVEEQDDPEKEKDVEVDKPEDDEPVDDNETDDEPVNDEPVDNEPDLSDELDGEDDTDLEGEEPEDIPDEDEDVLDMTNASTEDVIRVFRALKPDDGIIVKKDGDNLELNVDGEDYIIKLNEQEESPELSDDETIYEIELDDDDDEESNTNFDDLELDDDELGNNDAIEGEFNEEKDEPYTSKSKTAKGNKNEPFTKPSSSKGSGPKNDPFTKTASGKRTEPKLTKSNPKGVKEGDVAESSRTGAMGYRPDDHGSTGKKAWKAGNKRDEYLNEEVKRLKKQNEEYKKALVLFKDKLNEVAVFNANLAYSTKLFTENTTTKQEKMNILKRFDSISTIKESKNLYNTIKTELETKKPVTESVSEKISSNPKSSSTNVLEESKVYENPTFKRIKELMFKVK